MKIAFFEIEGWEKEMINGAFAGHEIFFIDGKVDDYKGSQKDFDVISVFTCSPVNEKTIGEFSNLKLITTRSTGYDHIDLKYCESRNIKVAFVPGYGDNTVAEFAFGLILSLTRRVFDSVNRVRIGREYSSEGLRGMDLKGKTIGIIGTGRIGKEAIEISKGFGMKVVAYDIFPNQKYAEEKNISYVSLEDLLKSSDIISIHAPLTDETHHLINMKNIELVKKGCYLVNTARGAILETEAIIYALDKGLLAGAGLDVMEGENDLKEESGGKKCNCTDQEEINILNEDHVLMKMENVLITPHNAFNTKEAVERILDTTILNIKGFMAGSLEEGNVAK